tara:strand:+ start:3710 stop:3862 length:153 start_codon:yes stop_codon:yes gene_type:complete
VFIEEFADGFLSEGGLDDFGEEVGRSVCAFVEEGWFDEISVEVISRPGES